MRRDYDAALARVQSDYAFYIHCQSDPEAALADYELSPEEAATFSDPQLLSDALKKQGEDEGRLAITVKISGTHDWINRSVPPPEQKDVSALITSEIESVRQAGNDEERREAMLRLVRLIG
ncbi:hypothetical protein [Streptomyces rubellomurinus]|uniref:Uncharacterized protein n=2 Tax=Streptomyces TaxID=1883 RepID=A0A0F2TAT3_STRR3|nr:hypothetical protein [Streptomyces rubellomurinus]KJS58832.1 hypothetical protein VM95_30785 [Streptomyces rubellomurinus]